MLRFSLFQFPVRVHWTFALVALFIGGGFRVTNPTDWPPVLAAMAVIFISILVHEVGHAVAGRRFGARPSILLHSMGGLCYLPGAFFTRNQNILVSLAGPGAGLLLAAFSAVVVRFVPPEQYLLRYALGVSLSINVLWTFLNLLPILPLDGGQVCRELLGPTKIELTRKIGVATAGVACLAALYFGYYIGAILAAGLAYLNFQGNAVDGGVVTAAPPDDYAPSGRGS